MSRVPPESIRIGKHGQTLLTRRLGDSLHAYAVMLAKSANGGVEACQVYRPFAPLFAGSPLRVAISDEGSAWTLAGTVPFAGPRHGEHIRDSMHAAAGVRPVSWRLRLPAPPSAQPYVVVCPHAAVGYKEWLPERWAALIERILACGHAVVVCGQPGRARFAAPSDTRFLDVDVPRLAGLIAGARCLVSTDSGQVHLADALGIPVVGLYAATSTVTYGPYGSRQFCVDRHDLAHGAGGRYDSSRHIAGPVMQVIAVDEVADRLWRVLESTSEASG